MSNPNKPTTPAAPVVAQAPAKVGTNYLRLPFPNDPQGSQQPLKTGAIKTINRIMGDQNRQDNFMKTLGVLKKFAEETFVAEVAKRDQARTNFIAAQARVAIKQREAAIAKAQELEDQAAALRASAVDPNA